MNRRILVPTTVLIFGSIAIAMAAQVQTKESQAATTPSRALELLREGNARFVSGKGVARNWKEQVAATAPGQHPYAAVLSCMDSRVPTEIVLDQGIGDVFSLRVAGNVVDTDVLGSLEYAAKVVGVKLILVLGHSDCGAVKGAIDGVELGNLTSLLAKIRPAVASAGPAGTSKDKAFVDRVAERNVRLSIQHIREGSPLVKEMVDSGKVGLAGAMYDMTTGRVTFSAD